VGWGELDTSKDSFELISKLILADYRYIRNDVTEVTGGMPLYHSILTGIANGDGQMHSAFKRANISNDVGSKAIEELCELGIIYKVKSKKIFTSWKENESVSNKFYFTSPFIKFWFAFVSPLFKGARDGDFNEIKTKFLNKKNEYYQAQFIHLAQESIKIQFSESDPIVEIGSYWDSEHTLDIFAKTKSNKTIVGNVKYTNTKSKKSELTKLKDMTKSAKIDADIYIIFSKEGFSSELKSLKSESLKLYTIKSLKNLLK